MAVEWTSDLAVGVPNIDKQHQELFCWANKLIVAMQQGKGKAEISEIISFLGKYVVEHFRDEEAYMARVGYPGLGAQQAQHAKFVATFKEIEAKFENGGSSSALVIAVHGKVVDWLKTHIGGMDKEIGKFQEMKKAA